MSSTSQKRFKWISDCCLFVANYVVCHVMWWKLLFNQIYSEHQQCLLQATCGSLACHSITVSVNFCSWYASCICRQVTVCCCRPFVTGLFGSVLKRGCKQLKQICSCFEQLKHCLSYNLKHLSHVNCLCDPLHENIAAVLLSYNVKLTDLTPADCWLWRDSNRS